MSRTPHRPPAVEALEDRTLLSITTIDFDHGPDGLSMLAPRWFAPATHLTELYAPLGVHFSGPSDRDGGAILNDASNFGVPAHSGSNFLAFNIHATMGDGGVARDPETIRFDTPAAAVAIYAAGGEGPATFTMDAFDANGALVATSAVTTQDYSLLRVVSSDLRSTIASVVLTATDSASGTWVYDELTFGDRSAATVMGVDAVFAGTGAGLVGQGATSVVGAIPSASERPGGRVTPAAIGDDLPADLAQPGKARVAPGHHPLPLSVGEVGLIHGWSAFDPVLREV